MARGFSDRHFERGEGRGDEVDCALRPTSFPGLSPFFEIGEAKRETVLGTRLPCALSLFSCHEQDGDSLSLGSHQTSAKCVDDQPSRWSQNNFFSSKFTKQGCILFLRKVGGKSCRTKSIVYSERKEKISCKLVKENLDKMFYLIPPPPPQKKVGQKQEPIGF